MSRPELEQSIKIAVKTVIDAFTLEINCTIPASGVTAIYGPSGSGKSTLLKWLAGLYPSSGTFVLGEQRLHDLPAHQRSIGYVSQDSTLFPHLTVLKNIRYGFDRKPPQQRSIELDTVIDWFRLEDLLERKPDSLSGGEKQRVALARAIASSPQLLLLDEPLSALDPVNKKAIFPLLSKLKEELCIPIILVSHALEEVLRLADHMLLLRGGTIVDQGPASNVLASATMDLLDTDEHGTIISAQISERDERWQLLKASFEGGELWMRDGNEKLGTPVRLRLLAKDISLSNNENTEQSILNILPAEVIKLTQGEHPSTTLVQLAAGPTQLMAKVTSKSAHALQLQPGKRVWAQVKSVAVLE